MHFFKEHLNFRLFNIYNFANNVENFAHSMNIVTQRIYIILYVRSTQFFIKCTQFYTFKVHNFSKNVKYSAHSTNLIFLRIYIILYIILNIQHTHFFKECFKFFAFNERYYSEFSFFCTFEVSDISKNSQNSTCSPYTII